MLSINTDARRVFSGQACVSRAYRKRVRLLSRAGRMRDVIGDFAQLTRLEKVGIVTGALIIAGVQCVGTPFTARRDAVRQHIAAASMTRSRNTTLRLLQLRAIADQVSQGAVHHDGPRLVLIEVRASPTSAAAWQPGVAAGPRFRCHRVVEAIKIR